MFEFLFKYPVAAFAKGRFVFLSTWPLWLLAFFLLLSIGGLGLATYRKQSTASPTIRGWRLWVQYGMQSAFLCLILLLLWQPAISVASLTSHQNIIAVVIDDSRSMAILDSNGTDRESAAINLLKSGLLTEIKKRFQIRLYRLGAGASHIETLNGILPSETATNINSGLKQLAEDTVDLPIGAIVLLTDGAQNTAELTEATLTRETLDALNNRRIPVHTVGFGKTEISQDLELENVSLPSTTVINSRVSATISFVQQGYTGKSALIEARDGDKILAAKEVSLVPDGILQTTSLFFAAGIPGARDIQFSISPLNGETNLKNNILTRPVLVNDSKRRILYVEGEPRWEFKFIRRAEDEDPSIQLVSMLRTSENKIYRQGIKDPSELASGFPSRPEDLFEYAGIIVGSVDADYFTPAQRELLREFVDRRGGGILFLGGRMALSDGGWGSSSISELLPTFLPKGRNSFHRSSATVELTPEGTDSSVTRLLDDPAKNFERWKKLTYLADYQDAGTPKPGAVVLAQLISGQRKLPLLITQNYGHGRTAVLATGGTWRWQMSEALGDPTHNLFWQQLLRWLVTETPTQVTGTLSSPLLLDDGHIQFRAKVYDAQFQPAINERVLAHILGPHGIDSTITLQPSREASGEYIADWNATQPGSYVTELSTESDMLSQDSHRATLSFRRDDALAENFRTSQNQELLRQLSQQTGGQYWSPVAAAKSLARDVSYSDAGISIRKVNELWNMPIVFLLLLLLPMAQWLLRRKWGIV